MATPRGPGPREDVPPSLRRTVKRARFRLGLMEWFALAGAVVMALLGGVVVAFFLSEGLGMPFRAVWIGASLVLFVIPAAAFLLKRGQD